MFEFEITQRTIPSCDECRSPLVRTCITINLVTVWCKSFETGSYSEHGTALWYNVICKRENAKIYRGKLSENRVVRMQRCTHATPLPSLYSLQFVSEDWKKAEMENARPPLRRLQIFEFSRRSELRLSESSIFAKKLWTFFRPSTPPLYYVSRRASFKIIENNSAKGEIYVENFASGGYYTFSGGIIFLHGSTYKIIIMYARHPLPTQLALCKEEIAKEQR